MIRISEHYVWGFVLSVFAVILLVMGAIILETEAYLAWREFTTFDYLVITLATWRMTRLLQLDLVTRFLREQFMDVVKSGRGYRLEQPKTGVRRLLAELFACPWCLSFWVGAFVLFLYLLTPYAIYPMTVLSLSAAATFLHNLSQLVANQSERARKQVDLL